MDLDFSSIHEENKNNKKAPWLRKPSRHPTPMIPSMNHSANRNSFTPFVPSLSNTNALSFNNTRLSNKVILEMDRQTKQVLGPTRKKPTRYASKELRFKKAK